MKTLTSVLFSCALVTVACSKSEDKKADDGAETPASEPAGKTTEPTTAVTKNDAPPVAAFSEEAAANALGELPACKNRYDCAPLKTLIAFGDKASAGLADIAVDTTKDKKARQIALHGLAEIKDPKVGLRLFEAGKIEKDFITQNDLFKVAGEGGGDDVFTAMIEHYASDDSKKYRTGLGFGVKKLDQAKIFAWALERFPTDEKKQLRFANLLMDTSTAADRDKLAEVLGKTKYDMARHHLASALVKHGDISKLDILVAGLKDKSEYVRADAGNMLAKVVDQVPADRKAEIVELVTAARAKDKGGLTSIGYDRILKKLQ